MRHLMSPLDFSVEELDQLLDLAADIEKHPAKYAQAGNLNILPSDITLKFEYNFRVLHKT